MLSFLRALLLILLIEAVRSQTGGSFSLLAPSFSFGEDCGTGYITVERNGGSLGRIGVIYNVFLNGADTAVNGINVILENGLIIFEDGVIQQNIAISIIDDTNYDPINLYKTFHVEISLIGGEAYAVVGQYNSAIVKIYDVGDAFSVVSSSFQLQTGVSSNTDGWTVVGNNNNNIWVDVNGLYSNDQWVGPEDYIESCDDVDQVPCVGNCPFGGQMIIAGGHAAGLLNLQGGYVINSNSRITGMSGTAISATMWIKSTDTSPSAILLNYAAGNFLSNAFTLMNPSDLSVIIGRGVLVGANNRGFRTNVNVADGLWHHLVVTWRSFDGRVTVFKDGLLVFEDGPYRSGYTIPNGSPSSLILGQALSSPCNTNALTPCSLVAGSTFQGEVQYFKLWDAALTATEALSSMHVPFIGSVTNLLIDWRFDSSSGSVIDASIQSNNGKYSSTGLSFIPGWPTTKKLVNCLAVYGHRWYFSAPSKFLNNLTPFIGGRLSFKLNSPSHSGVYRNTRNALVIVGSNGLRILYNINGFQEQSNSWRSYVVPLFLDGSWTYENYSPVSLSDFNLVLSDVTELLILGDIWTFDLSGMGTEIVYINDIALSYSNGLSHL